jgi:hypothetical protein
MRSNEEGAMLRRLLSRVSANVVYQLGTGRALDNARRDQIELTLTMAAVDALAGRIAPAADPAAADRVTRAAA